MSDLIFYKTLISKNHKNVYCKQTNVIKRNHVQYIVFIYNDTFQVTKYFFFTWTQTILFFILKVSDSEALEKVHKCVQLTKICFGFIVAIGLFSTRESFFNKMFRSLDFLVKKFWFYEYKWRFVLIVDYFFRFIISLTNLFINFIYKKYIYLW